MRFFLLLETKKNGDDFVLTALLCAAEDGNFIMLKNLLQLVPIDVNKCNKVSYSDRI
jgi:hypothetical protein